MFFNKENKKAFFAVAKTGSTSLTEFLNTLGWKWLNCNPDHDLNEIIAAYPNLANYNFYGFIRDPLLRFESCILQIKRADTNSYFKDIVEKQFNKNVEQVSYDEVIDVFELVKEKFPLHLIKQSFRLNHSKVTVLDFDNYEAELRRATGNTTDPVPVLNVATDFGKSVVTDKVRAFVREYYAADYALAKDRLGKEYNP